MIQSPSLESLEQENNENAVRMRLAHNQYSPPDIPIVEEWLRRKEVMRDELAFSKRDARDEETLSVAKDANSIALAASYSATAAAAAASEANVIARSNRRIAITAAVIAAIAAIAAIVAAIAAVKGLH